MYLILQLKMKKNTINSLQNKPRKFNKKKMNIEDKNKEVVNKLNKTLFL